ncbi:MAG: pyridoxamine 5'-phosphate oxidase family protein [Acetobacteraceae bacterium]|nr:pyridoxamine 5'-phosphate oxidase family protein [Acetobacteraceae bacterium]
MAAIATIEELERIYGEFGAVGEASTAKVADHITPQYRRFIEAAPFLALATCGPEGLDCSPRGDRTGFVRIADPGTLLLPDRRGNNRIDSLRNVVRDPRVTEVYFQCARAIIRAGLWRQDSQVDPRTLPTPGQILAEMSQGRVGGEAYDNGWAERARQTMW